MLDCITFGDYADRLWTEMIGFAFDKGLAAVLDMSVYVLVSSWGCEGSILLYFGP